MKLTIITINRNNASGLRKTIESVLNQSSMEFEYIIIDGASTDDSLQIIQQFCKSTNHPVNFISELDTGIYNAMNKGIGMAKGEYVQFLNSGDILVSKDVTEKMLNNLDNPKSIEILYGNMLKPFKGKIIRDKSFAGRVPTMLDFYTGTLNHSPAYIKRSLFDTYGLYDENLKIVSDWKWYLEVVALNNIIPVYIDLDVTVFDMNGISNVNSLLDKMERRFVLEEVLPLSVLADYDQWAFSIEQVKRINRYWLVSKGFWLVERMLFKWEK
ncbi:MAG: glycosyltransferase family 2 protein [Paludibacter sp.]|nr:glycosyltransferase family 2 protein [Paludibacter sp.]